MKVELKAPGPEENPVEDVEQRREFTRVASHLTVELESDSGKRLASPARDVAMSGVYVDAAWPGEVGDPCRVTIFLEGDGGIPPLTALGRVVRVEPEGTAVDFTELSLDAYEHLKNLVRLNSDNIEQVEAELRSHLGIRRKS
jgi:hypothetical protein